MPSTKAQSLDGKLVDSVKIEDHVDYDPQTGIHTFSDGSKAKILTSFEEAAPHLTASLSTSRTKYIKKWMVI